MCSSPGFVAAAAALAVLLVAAAAGGTAIAADASTKKAAKYICNAHERLKLAEEYKVCSEAILTRMLDERENFDTKSDRRWVGVVCNMVKRQVDECGDKTW